MRNLEKIMLSTSLGMLSTTALSSVANAEMLNSNLPVDTKVNQTALNPNNEESFKLAAIYQITDYYENFVPEIADSATTAEWCLANGYDHQGDCESEGELCTVNACPHDNTFNKCECYCNVANECTKLGFDKTSCSSGYTLVDTCPLNSIYKKCIKNDCTDYPYTSCASGYVSAGTCLEGSITKYKCTASPCTGYDYTSCASGYVSAGTCLSGTTTKYKCTANPCTGYDYTSCASGYVSAGTCQSGTTTKYKCTANPCTGYDYTSCPSGYVSAGTCLSGTTTKYKCNITNAQKCKDAGYTKTSCSAGYALTTQCSYDGAYYKTCNITNAQKCKDAGYIKTSCPAGYALTTQCSYDGAYYKTCNITNAQRCINDGYVKSKTCNANHSTHQKRSACSYDGTYYKCVSMTVAEMCNNDGFYKTSCSSGYALTNKCSHGNYYLTCEKTAAQKCIDEGYTLNKTCTGSHPTHQTSRSCPYNTSYKKCIGMSTSEMCSVDGFASSVSCPSGYEKGGICSHDSKYFECVESSAGVTSSTAGSTTPTYTETCCEALGKSDCSLTLPLGEPCDFGGVSDVLYHSCVSGGKTYYYDIRVLPGDSLC